MSRITEWTPADLDTLRKMWTAGASAREIAYALGRSRNSVLGKIHRLNLETRTNLRRKPEAPRIGRVRSFPPQKHERKPPMLPMLQRVVVVPDAVPVPLLERTGCCYPVTTTSPHLFCNAQTEGRDYCETHYRIMYYRRAA